MTTTLFTFLWEMMHSHTWMIKPYNSRGLTHEKRVFNYRFSRRRRVVENAFGITAHLVGDVSSIQFNLNPWMLQRLYTELLPFTIYCVHDSHKCSSVMLTLKMKMEISFLEYGVIQCNLSIPILLGAAHYFEGKLLKISWKTNKAVTWDVYPGKTMLCKDKTGNQIFFILFYD